METSVIDFKQNKLIHENYLKKIGDKNVIIYTGLNLWNWNICSERQA